jgi:hypothetical protein
MLADYDKNDNNANKQEEVGMREPNIEKLNALVGKLVGDLGISLGGAKHTARRSPRALQGHGGWRAGHSGRTGEEDGSARAVRARMAIRPGCVGIYRLLLRKKELTDHRPTGGRGGIRTHGALAGTPVFKTGALNHSATLPTQRDQALR